MPRPSLPAPERLIGTLLYAPLGLGAKLVEDFPANVTKARQQVQLARFIGKMAVDQGAKELKARLDPSEPMVADVPGDDMKADAEKPEIVGNAPPEAPLLERVPDEASLALPDYSQLPAAHIISKLAGLTQDERDAVEAFETANRHRRTVLGKLGQLRDS